MVILIKEKSSIWKVRVDKHCLVQRIDVNQSIQILWKYFNKVGQYRLVTSRPVDISLLNAKPSH